MKNAITFLMSILALSVLSCNSPDTAHTKSEDAAAVSEEPWVPEVPKSSELAELMRLMFETNKLRKQALLNGESFLPYSDNFRRLHTAKHTDESKNNALFHSLAEAHIISDSLLTSLKGFQKKKEAFNGHINNCVACHDNFCGGPINKIKTLLILD
ncbi:MAG: hypothetical protein N4A45_00240 [Flavobacteriales bacterium]|jgi:hypothetical protein|nr:hypothetical protein [Flavobacteriales bacterium]